MKIVPDHWWKKKKKENTSIILLAKLPFGELAKLSPGRQASTTSSSSTTEGKNKNEITYFKMVDNWQNGRDIIFLFGVSFSANTLLTTKTLSLNYVTLKMIR